MLAKGADPNITIADGSAALHWAAYNGSLEIVNLLLEREANPLIADAEKWLPLHMAAYNAHMPIVARLLACDLDINAQDDYGDTFLYILVANDAVSPEERLYRFLESMQAIEKKEGTLLTELTEIMEGFCPDLNNGDTKNILAMMVDYVQGINLTLANQEELSVLDVVQAALEEDQDGQAYEEVVKTLARHQKLGGWMNSSVQLKRKFGTPSNTSSPDAIQERVVKKAKVSYEDGASKDIDYENSAYEQVEYADAAYDDDEAFDDESYAD